MRFNLREVTSQNDGCGIRAYSGNSLSELQHYTGEIGKTSIAAIDDSGGEKVYGFPVDVVIDKRYPRSWRRARNHILERAEESDDPTIVRVQHEYGLAGTDWARYDNYVPMIRAFYQAQQEGQKILTVTNLHTVLRNPTRPEDNPDNPEFPLEVILGLAKYSDALVVQTRRGKSVLTEAPYNIDPDKIVHINHGVREVKPGKSIDPNEIKEKYNFGGVLTTAQIGLISDGKGIQYGLRAYGEFKNENFSADSSQLENMIYLVLGQEHPGFKRDAAKSQANWNAINSAMNDTGLRSKTVGGFKELSRADILGNDVIFVNTSLSEREFGDAFRFSDIIVSPYCHPEQMSSGPTSAAVGTGAAVLSAKFDHAIEMFYSDDPSVIVPEGLVGVNPHSRGLLVDLEGKQVGNRMIYTPSISQLKEGFKAYIIDDGGLSGTRLRRSCGKNLTRVGVTTSWSSVTKNLMNTFEGLLKERFAPTSKVPRFSKETS